MKPYALIFDFDGTLFFHTTEINYYAINKALEDLGRAPVSRETANSTVGDRIPDACRRLLGTDDKALNDAFLAGLLRHTPEAIQTYATLDEDCRTMLRNLSTQAPLAICSNAEHSYLYTLLEKFDIKQYFSFIWCRKEGYDKAKALPLIKEAIGVAQCVMVGDREEDITAGKVNGCITVAIQNDFGARDAIDADYNVYSHREMETCLQQIINKGV